MREQTDTPPRVSLPTTAPGDQFLTGKHLVNDKTGRRKCAFFGQIPYAQPPVGELRFRQPRPLPDDFNYFNYGGAPSRSGDYSSACLPCCQAPLAMNQLNEQPQTEDCLRLNIWIPLRDTAQTKPKDGWPVLVYLHGGFLQMGSPSSINPSTLLAPGREDGGDLGCIVVTPGYRVGVLGFLASREVCGQSGERSANFGLWDQRVALEWTAKHIAAFGGDAGNITVGGMSAGAYSAFLQMVYDLRQPLHKRLIRRVLQCSNGCGLQPKAVGELQPQFNDLMQALSIDNPNGSAVFAVNSLREKSVEQLTAAVPKLKQKFFRPVTDGAFIKDNLIASLSDGTLAKQMAESNIQLMIGEVAAESKLYATFYPPSSHRQLVDRLGWDFTSSVVDEACRQYKGDWKLDKGWMSTFGKLYSMMQVHATIRGQVDSLFSHGSSSQNVYRYRIEYRSAVCATPKSMGATHGTDLAIWFMGNGQQLPSHERQIALDWLKPMGYFLRGDNPQWGTSGKAQVRLLSERGEVRIDVDNQWGDQIAFWQRLLKSDASQTR